MKPTIKIDFVSDIACPWCAVGLGNLYQAMAKFRDIANFEVHFRAFELNPKMPKGGQDAIEHLTEKYGLSAEQVKANQHQIRIKALEAGFEFHPEGRKRVYNTFAGHRLLFWAAKEYDLLMQAALKKELLNSYFCLAVDLDDEQNLLDAVGRAGLDQVRAQQILQGDEFTQAVREEEAAYVDSGIHAVPSIILNERHLLQGAQPPESFMNAFDQLLQAHTTDL
ncbi:Predicted dithiol-disulfide isomerase, DsbA family [Polynucleobacter meluiroseus]|uniref:Predicted dithiol-disulfide isomerase, DsbA family n=1 Tax=Polynucleobacter meluiroseus TaxID=1938814 RepID=A0A240DXX4_9BURK|nr:DsbA family oxidoreductase [Polynucleobacter meluiroseus]SNX28045.1 Predicted dithiol-disulfide isomerase, DsbA family [Polynucleobacter meluiroseus]